MEETTEQAQEPMIGSEQSKATEAFPQQIKQAYQAERPADQSNATGGEYSDCEEEDGILSLEEFTSGFINAFNIAGDVTGLKSFPIKEKERLGAEKTAEKLYKIALKYPAFQFLIARKSYWLYDFSLIAGFVAMKTNDIVEEKLGVSLTQKLLGIFKWKKEKTENGSGFLGRLVAGRQQKVDS